MNFIQMVYVFVGAVLAIIIYARVCINELRGCKAYLEYNMTDTKYVNYLLNIFWMIILAPLIIVIMLISWPVILAIYLIDNSEALKEKIGQFLLRGMACRKNASNASLLKRKETLKAKLASQILANTNETRYRVAAVGQEILDNPKKLQEISFLDAKTVSEYCTLCKKLA